MTKQFGAGLLLGAALISGIWAATYYLISRSPSSGPPGMRSPEGQYIVNFSVVTSKTQASESWSGGDIQNVVAIDFYPGYIIVQTKEGRGTVFFPERTKDLGWRTKGEK